MALAVVNGASLYGFKNELLSQIASLLLVDCPTQLIYIGISICQHTSKRKIAGQSAALL